MSAKTLLDKLWDDHVVADLGNNFSLLHIDRHLIHDLGGPRGLRETEKAGRRVRNPDLSFAFPDHSVPSTPGRALDGGTYASDLRVQVSRAGIKLFDLGQPGQGIVHVTGPELGITLPGVTLVCGDSHTCTHGGMGALAFGIGWNELCHVLATQTLVQQRPKRLRVTFDGVPAQGIQAKDFILYLIGQIGAAAGTGYAVEYAGSAIRALPVEGRLTMCNLSIELGAKAGMVAPDDVTYEYLADRPYAPKGAMWDRALAHWRTLHSDAGTTFDREVHIDVAKIRPQITWGTSPQDVIGVDEMVPDPDTVSDPGRRNAMRAALTYMGLEPGKPIEGTPVDWVFIGSCTNSRLSDLQSAAAVAKGRKVAPGVKAWVVPGSENVKRAAEAEGLDRVFLDAGFEWREASCSLCVGANGEMVSPGQRSVSTSNRNFVGRQGPGARTHLASPAMAAAAALSGAIADLRKLGN